jgi:hypothetical protein
MQTANVRVIRSVLDLTDEELAALANEADEGE